MIKGEALADPEAADALEDGPALLASDDEDAVATKPLKCALWSLSTDMFTFTLDYASLSRICTVAAAWAMRRDLCRI